MPSSLPLSSFLTTGMCNGNESGLLDTERILGMSEQQGGQTLSLTQLHGAEPSPYQLRSYV